MRKWTLAALLIALLVIGLSAGVLAGLGDDDSPGNVVIQPNPDPPGGDPCVCPQIYDPVICKVGNEKRLFSNACFAGCAGATECRKFVVKR